MSGKKPVEAVRAYLEPLQQSLSCFTKKVLRPPRDYPVGQVLVATFSHPAVELLTEKDETLRLSFIQYFTIASGLFSGITGHKVKTHSYYYAIENEYGHEILCFHCHPEGDNPVMFPHLHLKFGAGDRLRSEFNDIHLRTARTSFEEVGLLLIDEFKVIPARDDAREILLGNWKKFEKYKTWDPWPTSERPF